MNPPEERPSCPIEFQEAFLLDNPDLRQAVEDARAAGSVCLDAILKRHHGPAQGSISTETHAVDDRGVIHTVFGYPGTNGEEDIACQDICRWAQQLGDNQRS